MTDGLIDPLLLGQRVVAILETGLRTATYKLATLTALIDQCIEHLPETPDGPLTVPIADLAHRVLETYWRQVRPFDGRELRQSTQPRARILTAASMFRAAPLAGLLKPALEIMWVDDVRRMNKFLDAEVPDVAGHLFGRERISLAAVQEPFKDVFGARCFYCNTALRPGNPVDHVLPWSLVGIDGLANLVLACARCNGDKRQALPSPGIIDRVLGRDRIVLEQIADDIDWPTQYRRTVAAARGLYRGQAPGVPTWSGYRQSTRLDISHPQWWIRAGMDAYDAGSEPLDP
jgi:hypothetical protein